MLALADDHEIYFRVIQQRLQNPLAVELLKREIAEGSRVRIDYADGEFSFERAEPPAASQGGGVGN